MKIAIIGAGNMGGAIARSLAGREGIDELRVANRSTEKLISLAKEAENIITTTDNNEAIEGADVVILAVKPWLLESVIAGLKLDKERQTIVSVAAGVTFRQMEEYLNKSSAARLSSSSHSQRTGNSNTLHNNETAHINPSAKAEDGWVLFRVMPNTAIAHGESMTLVASKNASKLMERKIKSLFDSSGLAMTIAEDKMDASTAVASCGIAFAMKYVQAAMQAGIEMGLTAHEAQMMAAQSMKGAAEILLSPTGDATLAHPSREIDRVCTPGGMTIRGINTLEHKGFSSAVIAAMKACTNKEQ